MDSCPCCERPLRSISDYPLVYVAKVERFSLPSEMQFLIHDPDIFVGPKSKCGNSRPPKAVLEFFKGNSEAQEYEYKGWTWKLEQEWNREGARISLSEKVKQFSGVPIKAPEAWEIGSYSRTQKGQFSRETVTKYAAKYLDYLETLVGKEVPSKEVFPKFGNLKWGYICRIPETQYDLALEEISNDYGDQILTQEKLPIPKLETEKPSRKIAFCITESSGGSVSEIKFLSVLGGMAYEGRLKS